MPPCKLHVSGRGGSRTAAASKMERFVIIICGNNHKTLHLGCCKSPKCASVRGIEMGHRLEMG